MRVKGKYQSKGKVKGGDGKGGKLVHLAHKDTTVQSIIQGDSQADVQSVARHATILLNAHVQ